MPSVTKALKANSASCAKRKPFRAADFFSGLLDADDSRGLALGTQQNEQAPETEQLSLAGQVQQPTAQRPLSQSIIKTKCVAKDADDAPLMRQRHANSGASAGRGATENTDDKMYTDKDPR